MNFTFIFFRLILFAIINFNFRYDSNNQVEASPNGRRGYVDSIESAVQAQEEERSAVSTRERRTSIIYLDATEGTTGKTKKSRLKQKKTKKQKGLKKKKRRTRKNKKIETKDKTYHGNAYFSKNGTATRKTIVLPSDNWKEIVPESNQSDSKLSGEREKQRKPVDIIVHIKMKE